MVEVFKHWRCKNKPSLICKWFHRKWFLGYVDCKTELLICYKCDRTFERPVRDELRKKEGK